MDNGLKYNEGTTNDYSDRYEGRAYYEGTLKPDNSNMFQKPQVDENMKRFQRPESNMNQQPVQQPQTVGTASMYSGTQSGSSAGVYSGTQSGSSAGVYSGTQADSGASRYSGTQADSSSSMYSGTQNGNSVNQYQNPHAGSAAGNPVQSSMSDNYSSSEDYIRPQVERVGSRLQFTPSSGREQTESAGYMSRHDSGSAGMMNHQQTGSSIYLGHQAAGSGSYMKQSQTGAIGYIDKPIHDTLSTDNTLSIEKPAEEKKDTDNKKSAETGKKKKKTVLGAFKMTAAALILGGLAGGSFYGVNHYLEKNNSKSKSAIETSVKSDAVSSQGITDLSGTSGTLNYDVAKISAEVKPSIVSITTTVTTTYQYYFQQFEQESTGAGSGIIIGKDDEHLYIATNHHVIEKASEINVGFVDGEIVKARVKGYDSNADIAVVVVDFADMKESTAEAIKIAAIGDSDDLVVGEPVIAIGNALGYGQSVTVGYISALDRKIEGGYGTYIQTDAAINPGNSGGALINSKGQVIGINSIKYVDSKVEGMGFSIPSNRAMSIIENIIEGKNGKTYIGLTGADISKEYAQIYGFPEGIYVKSVESSSPASKAGIHTGDIIVEFDGKSVYTIEELFEMVEDHNDGDKVSITIYRADDRGNYKKVELEVELGFSVNSDD